MLKNKLLHNLHQVLRFQKVKPYRGTYTVLWSYSDIAKSSEHLLSLSMSRFCAKLTYFGLYTGRAGGIAMAAE